MNLNKSELPVILIVAYNRPNSLRRILQSISNASYPDEDITLIISIDRGSNNYDVVEEANNFNWEYGSKKVIYQEENLGLKKHILKCMNLAYEYESIIMLEDDIYVSKSFYTYTQQALGFSKDKEYIAGISLYNHQMNVHTDQNFSPIEDGYDNWYFQFASSWGQAWSSKQLIKFLEWFNTDPDINEMKTVPQYVRNWPDKSWLKYFISFVVEQNRFFLYPKISLTTNFGDTGENMDMEITYFQVPLRYDTKNKYDFSSLNESNAVYDSYYENLNLSEYLEVKKEDLTIDLYGYKSFYDTRYIISSKIMDFEIVNTIGRSLKPHDANVFYNIKGKDFFLYDTTIKKRNALKVNKFNKASYYSKAIRLADSMVLTKKLFKLRMSGYFNKILGFMK